MREQYSAGQISKIIDQALVYQCACPAQVCKTIFELRELFAYQMGCADGAGNDRRVHGAIAKATERSHEVMEDCLREILQIEGWDLATLTMPASLRKKPAKAI
jgi:hypothetical protein